MDIDEAWRYDAAGHRNLLVDRHHWRGFGADCGNVAALDQQIAVTDYATGVIASMNGVGVA